MVRWAGADQVNRVPATDQRHVTRFGADQGKGFRAVTTAAVLGRENATERREGSHHLIARHGCSSPGGYRSPIRLAGGSRLLTSDPRDIGWLGGRGYRKPARPVDNDETQTPGASVRQRRGPL